MSGGDRATELFARLLPGREQTLLLRCLLLPREQARTAWTEWLELVGDPAVLLRPGARSVRGLNVALLQAMRTNELDAPPETVSILKLGALKEEMRSQAYRRVLADTLRAFAAGSVPVLVCKGAALAGTVYPRAGLRHCHDIDLLVAGNDLERAALAAAQAGFRPAASHEAGCRLVHADGLPLELHTRPLPAAATRHLAQEWWRNAQPVRLSGVEARTVAAGLALLQVCALAFFTPARSNLRWVTDCWHIVHGHRPIDWDQLLAAAHHAQVSRAVEVVLGYLGSALDAAVPAPVLLRAREAAAGERLGGERALYAVWSTTRRNPGALRWMLGGRRVRGEVLRWALAPSAEYLRGAGIRSGWRLPLAYLHRPLRYATERVRIRLRRRRRARDDGHVPTASSTW